MRAHVRLALLLILIVISPGFAGTSVAQVLTDEQIDQSIKMREEAIKQKNEKIAEQEAWIKEREKVTAEAQRAQAKYRQICGDPQQVVIRLLPDAGFGARYAVTARSKADLRDDLYFYALLDLMDPEKKKDDYENEVAMMMGAYERAQALFKALENQSNGYKRSLLVEVNRLAQVIDNGRSRIQEAKKDMAKWKGEIDQLKKEIATLRNKKKGERLDVAYALEGEWKWFSGGILKFTNGQGEYSDPRDPKKKGACTASVNPDTRDAKYKGYAIKLTWNDHWEKGRENYYRDYLNIVGWGEQRPDGSHGRATNLKGINNVGVSVTGDRPVPQKR